MRAHGRREREYIWGPGDGRGGVDELLAQCDAERKLWPVLTDAGGDVVAVVGRSGPGPNAVAVVAGQWAYDAYGAVISADHLLPHPMNKVGHKGLFAERLDVGVADATVQGSVVHGDIGVETPKLVSFGHHIYHNRNRVLHPHLGRFMQSDPNASGVVVMNSLGYLGMMGTPYPQRVSLAQQLGDGAPLFAYLRSQRWDRRDPLGLWTIGPDGSSDPMKPWRDAFEQQQRRREAEARQRTHDRWTRGGFSKSPIPRATPS